MQRCPHAGALLSAMLVERAPVMVVTVAGGRHGGRAWTGRRVRVGHGPGASAVVAGMVETLVAAGQEAQAGCGSPARLRLHRAPSAVAVLRGGPVRLAVRLVAVILVAVLAGRRGRAQPVVAEGVPGARA